MDRIKEAARYLGYKAKSNLNQIEKVIKTSFLELEELSSPKSTYRIFNLSNNSFKKIKEVEIELPGKSINSHLEGSSKVVLMGATLGLEVDKRIRYYQYKDLTKSLILDACASTLIEEVCDDIEINIKNTLGLEDKMTSRFSPGYGDLPLSFQKTISKILFLEKTIGVVVNKNNILIPRKSVTAIIGVGEDKKISHCNYCNLNCDSKEEQW
ncbi:MAG: methionine synthase [Parcubacteria group bacterium]